ncbi:MAG: hypothetical protein EOL88_06930 [Bacteroidia bacterium]|jgi:carbon monoxide dehydrogenase subunit G|nr:hypothetical protein [Bacteroidales bacterium]NCD41809.1 hypothetical protein [Bacteroidia bacterium]MDD2322225.1 hypothetical protein [Bacteroidales bacterium]MDD3009787.1 hypothetical protein [Bacteroidales bacterium]MDD3960297.1 hypothetical protein [Bacteroidales bacterium]
MIEFPSKTRIHNTAENIYNFLADFNNFKNIIPEERVKNYRSTKETCAFQVENMPEFRLKMGTNKPVTTIEMVPESSSGIHFMLSISLEPCTESTTEVTLKLQADLNPFMKMMAGKALQTFVDTLAVKLKNHMEC